MNRRYILPKKKYRHLIPATLLPKRGGLIYLKYFSSNIFRRLSFLVKSHDKN